LADAIANATGRRKTSVARVRLYPGTGNVTINGKNAPEYFNRETLVMEMSVPLVETQTLDRYDIVARCHGGGKRGQAGAMRLGIARALAKANPDLHTALRRTGLLTRDSRMKERKKYGQPGARKRFQFSKR
jgi:small subunit ribosomal protein S9